MLFCPAGSRAPSCVVVVVIRNSEENQSNLVQCQQQYHLEIILVLSVSTLTTHYRYLQSLFYFVFIKMICIHPVRIRSTIGKTVP